MQMINQLHMSPNTVHSLLIQSLNNKLNVNIFMKLKQSVGFVIFQIIDSRFRFLSYTDINKV